MRRDSRGVTLIELVIALAVTGIVVAAAHAALGVVMDALHRSRAERTAAAGEAARGMLAGWLRGAALPDSGASFDGVNAWRGGKPSDTLRFVVTDGGVLYPGPHHLALWIDDDPGSDRAGLLAEITPWPAAAVPPETLVVAQRAAALDVHYLVAGQGAESWVGDWSSRTQLPFAIALRVGIPPRAGAGRPAGDELLGMPLVVPVATTRW